MEFIYYPILGIFAGLLSGLFGIGGGLIIVPVLHFALSQQGVSPEIIQKIAIGTSLMTIVVNISTSVQAQHKKKNVRWDIVKKMAPIIVIGTISGSFLSSLISAKVLEIIFSIYVLIVCAKMFFKDKEHVEAKKTSDLLYSIVSFIIGLKSSILGIGGGTISIPFLLWRGHNMRTAIGVSAAIGLPISISGALSYMYFGYGNALLPKYCIGFVSLPAFIGIISTSIISAKIGVHLSHKLSHTVLRVGFAVFLLLIAIKSILNFV